MKSKSLITNKFYYLTKYDDKDKINNFLKNNNDKKIVVVQGLGFVGLAMSLVVANKNNYAVIGVDQPTKNSYWKIASINEGIIPIISSDKKLKKYFDKAKEKENFYATYDEYAYSVADFIIIDINLDVKKISNNSKKLINYHIDLKKFKNSISTVLKNCKEDILMLIETTVPPGTCIKIVKPLVEKIFLSRGLNPKKFKLAHSYERVMPGPNYIDSIENFYRVYSGINENSTKAAESFLKSIIKTAKYPLTRLSNTNASEIAKVLENSYRAMNIAFIQEWTELADKAGVNLYEIISAIQKRHTHKNIMRPGLGVGGYCLTKDPLMASWASKNNFNHKPLIQSEIAVNINDQMPLYSFEFLKKTYGKSLKKKKVLFFGVSYLNDIGDTRSTPSELIYDKLKNIGVDVYLHDPYLTRWTEKNLAIDNKLERKNLDIIIVTVSHKQFISKKYLDYINAIQPELILDTLGCYLGLEDKISNKTNLKIIGLGK